MPAGCGSSWSSPCSRPWRTACRPPRAAARRRRPWLDPRPRARPRANPSRCRSTSRSRWSRRRRSRRAPRTRRPPRRPSAGPSPRHGLGRARRRDARRRDPVAPAPAQVAPVPEPARATAAPLAADAPGGDDLERLRRGWTTVVTTITERNRAAKPLISACRPIGVDGNVVTLGFPEEQGFLKDVAERRRPLLETTIGEFLGRDVGVRCVATNLDLVPPLPDDQEAAHVLAEAQRIFAEDRLDVPEVT